MGFTISCKHSSEAPKRDEKYRAPRLNCTSWNINRQSWKSDRSVWCVQPEKPKTVPLPPSISSPVDSHSHLPGSLRKAIVPYQRYIRVQTMQRWRSCHRRQQKGRFFLWQLMEVWKHLSGLLMHLRRAKTLLLQWSCIKRRKRKKTKAVVFTRLLMKASRQLFRPLDFLSHE